MAASLSAGAIGWFACAGLSLRTQERWEWPAVLAFGFLSIAAFGVPAFVLFAAYYREPPTDGTAPGSSPRTGRVDR